MVILLRLLALVLLLAAGWWVHQRWGGALLPPTALELPEKGTYRGRPDVALPAGTAEALQQRSLGQRF